MCVVINCEKKIQSIILWLSPMALIGHLSRMGQTGDSRSQRAIRSHGMVRLSTNAGFLGYQAYPYPDMCHLQAWRGWKSQPHSLLNFTVKMSLDMKPVRMSVCSSTPTPHLHAWQSALSEGKTLNATLTHLFSTPAV